MAPTKAGTLACQFYKELALQRPHAFVAQPLDPAHIPEHKLAINQKPTKENQDLYAAAMRGDLNGIKKALAAGGNPNWYKEDEEGAAALHRAAEGGHVACIELLLKSGQGLCIAVDILLRSMIDERLLTNHISPLHLACSSGHLEAVQALVAASADINTGNSYGNAPIHGALMASHRKIVEYLLSKEADARWINNKGSTLLHFVAYSSMAAKDKQDVAERLIEAGVDVNTQDGEGMTALHVAARIGDTDMVSLLLQYGANRGLKDASGKIPLQWAQLNSSCPASLTKLLSSP